MKNCCKKIEMNRNEVSLRITISIMQVLIINIIEVLTVYLSSVVCGKKMSVRILCVVWCDQVGAGRVPSTLH